MWERLGNPTVFVEPFAGTGAVTLARPGGAGPREIWCDTDGGVANFWRAVAWAPVEELVGWVDWPTIHQDLTARHRWLRGWIADNRRRLETDPTFYDVRAAGWWVWGASLWIGGGWCHVEADKRPTSSRMNGPGVSAQRLDMPDMRPHVQASSGGRGVSAQAEPPGKRPHVNSHNAGGSGVSAQTRPDDKRPHVADRGMSGRGVAAQRQTPGQIPHVKPAAGGQGVASQRTARPDLLSWFTALQERLARVVVLNRPWQSALTPTMLQHTPTGPKPPVAVFVDPPYRTDTGRHATIYGSDMDGSSDDAAVASYRWAVENGERFRVAYCCGDGDFPVPAGWSTLDVSFGGIRVEARRGRRDLIMFSPACRPDPNDQPRLFDV